MDFWSINPEAQFWNKMDSNLKAVKKVPNDVNHKLKFEFSWLGTTVS
jgi:hypothetical protein